MDYNHYSSIVKLPLKNNYCSFSFSLVQWKEFFFFPQLQTSVLNTWIEICLPLNLHDLPEKGSTSPAWHIHEVKCKLSRTPTTVASTSQPKPPYLLLCWKVWKSPPRPVLLNQSLLTFHYIGRFEKAYLTGLWPHQVYFQNKTFGPHAVNLALLVCLSCIFL